MRNIKYQTFNQLLDKVYDDFQMYDSNSLIEPSQLIRVVKKINKELGMRITKSKDTVVPLEDFTARLPQNLEKINYVLLCGSYTLSYGFHVQGDHTEAQQVTCSCDKTLFFNECNEAFIVVKTNDQKDQVQTFPVYYRLPIEESKKLGSFDVYGYIKGDYLHVPNFEEGNLYINYESVMEDEEGNLLVVDHPLLNDYYEYALKRRVLENVYLNGEESALQKLAFIEPRYKDAKREANGVADMPDFKEFQNTLDINRKAAHRRFYSMFQ